MSNSLFTNLYINHRNTCNLVFTILYLIDEILQFFNLLFIDNHHVVSLNSYNQSKKKLSNYLITTITYVINDCNISRIVSSVITMHLCKTCYKFLIRNNNLKC